jgi:hypothetical protein
MSSGDYESQSSKPAQGLNGLAARAIEWLLFHACTSFLLVAMFARYVPGLIHMYSKHHLPQQSLPLFSIRRLLVSVSSFTPREASP